MINPQQAIMYKSAIGSFFTWWLSELQQIFSATLSFGKSEIAEFRLDSAGEVHLAAEFDSGKTNKRLIKIEIPEINIMQRVIRLPGTAAGEAGRVIEFEFEKYFPIPFKDVMCVHEVLPAADHDSIEIKIRAIRKSLLAPVLRTIEEQYSLRPVELQITANGDSFTLRPGNTAAGRTARVDKNRSNWPVTILLPGLLLPAAYIPLYKLDLYRQQVNAGIGDLTTRVKDTIALRNKILEIEQNLHRVTEEKNNKPQFNRIWSAITEVMTGNGMLSSIRMHGDRVTIEGKAVSVEKVVKALEKNALFYKISIDAPVKSLEQGKFESMLVTFMVKQNGKN
ncbi:MAG: hypothetical protein OEZ39_13740 [Gammaproteobacteria bacterium]|nr:hypothetical protein [Gammaproteobacteria bacterium]MDH5652913.1 hypothetical protein [Gammaproteobacteria bacterium]